MKPYESYTVCPSLWNQVFPSHWGILPMYAIAREKSICNCVDLPLLSVYLDIGVIPFSAKAEKRTNVTSKDLSKYQRVDCGDFVLNNQQAWRGSVGIAFNTGIVSPAYIVLSMNDSLDSKYANYLLRSRVMVDQYLINSKSVGSIQRNIYWPALKRTMLPVPPRPEQDQIVRFLDWKVSSIIKLISVKRKQIALLHERQSVHISHIVTHGLRNGVAAKDSGAEWLGDIPEHWHTMRCKYLFSERDERSQDGSEQHLSMSQKYGLVPDSQLDERRMLSESYVGGKLCDKDDLVLNRLKAHLGVFALAPQSGVISPDYTVLKPNTERLLPSFAETVLKSDRCRGELRIRVRGIIEGFWRLYTDDFNTIVLPVPPLDEQAEIVEYIVELRNKAKKYEDSLTQEISTLQEFKTRLISDVVTGKIDVRDIEIPDFEYVEETVDSSDEDDGDMGDVSKDEEK